MPAKSRRKKAKNPPPSKRGKVTTGTLKAAAVESQPQTETPVIAKQTAPVRAARTRSTMAQEPVNTYPYIKSELWTIGILAVIMLAILGVLGVVL